MRPPRAVAAVLVALAASGLAACGDDDGATAPSVPEDQADRTTCAVATAHAPIDPVAVAAADLSGQTVTLLTHDSFALGDGVLAAFTAATGVDVELLTGGDAGSMISQAVLTAGEPVADVLFGVDNTLLCRALEADLFVPFTAAGLDEVAPGLTTDTEHRVTPVDYGDVCLNVDLARFAPANPSGPPVPTVLDDLLDPAYRDQLVVENPETSSPGLAFLLATIAIYGEDGWVAWWEHARDNGVLVVPGWEEAYNSAFSASGGDRGIVVSYASSPPVEVLFADPPTDVAPTAVVLDGCYRQVEYAGVLAGTDVPLAAAALVEFLLSPTVQEDVPLQMFVWPARVDVPLPDVFVDHAVLAELPAQLDPADVEARRDEWTEQWVDAVLR